MVVKVTTILSAISVGVEMMRHPSQITNSNRTRERPFSEKHLEKKLSYIFNLQQLRLSFLQSQTGLNFFAMRLQYYSIFCREKIIIQSGDSFRDGMKLGVKSRNALDLKFRMVANNVRKNEFSSEKYKQFRTFRSINLKRQIFFGFYIPAERHVLGNINLGDVSCSLDQNDVSELLSQLSFGSYQIKTDLTRIEKNRVAEMSTNFGQIVFEEPVKFSINLCVQQIALSYSISKSRSFQLLIEEMSVVTGDHLRKRFQLSSHQNFMKDLENRIEKFVNPLTFPVLVELKNFCVLNNNRFVIRPNRLCGLWNCSLIKSNADFCEQYIDIFATSLVVEIDFQVEF